MHIDQLVPSDDTLVDKWPQCEYEACRITARVRYSLSTGYRVSLARAQFGQSVDPIFCYAMRRTSVYETSIGAQIRRFNCGIVRQTEKHNIGCTEYVLLRSDVLAKTFFESQDFQIEARFKNVGDFQNRRQTL